MAKEFAKKFYNSKIWQARAEYIKQRDKYKCKICGETGDLEVHHKIKLTPSNISDVNITLNEDNLVTLCRSCHFAQHNSDKVRGTKEKNKISDCGNDFYFDADGNLKRRIPPHQK